MARNWLETPNGTQIRLSSIDIIKPPLVGAVLDGELMDLDVVNAILKQRRPDHDAIGPDDNRVYHGFNVYLHSGRCEPMLFTNKPSCDKIYQQFIREVTS